MFLPRRQYRKKYPQPPTRLHFDLYMITLQPFDHELILLAWRKPGPNRLPRSTSADAPVFRLGNADQTFLRRRIDRMVINRKAPFETPANRMFSW